MSSISSFYASKHIFITGGLGFIGKVLVEKLLYSCPDVDKIFLLVKSNESLSANERIENFKALPVSAEKLLNEIF